MQVSSLEINILKICLPPYTTMKVEVKYRNYTIVRLLRQKQLGSFRTKNDYLHHSSTFTKITIPEN